MILSKPTFDAKTETTQVQAILQDILHKLLDFIMHMRQNKWPELIVELCIGDKVQATYRCDPTKYLVAAGNAHQSGLLCNEKYSVIFKPAQCSHLCQHCGCFYGAAELQMSVDVANASGGIRTVGNVNGTTESVYTVNVFVHQAKMQPDCELAVSGLRLDAIVGRNLASTRLIGQKMLPIWNETLSFRGHALSVSPNAKWSPRNVPVLVVELMWFNKNKVYIYDIHYA